MRLRVMLRCGCLAAGMFWGSVPHASGEPALSLSDAWRTALANSLVLAQLDMARQRAAAEVAIQRAGYLPNLSAVGSYGYTSDVAKISLPLPTGQTELEAGVRNRYDAAVSVEQPVFTGFRTRNLVAAAEKQVGAERARKEAARNEVLLGVGEIFYQMQRNRIQQQILRQAIDRAETHLEKIRGFLAAAQATAFDTLEVANRKLKLRGQVKTLRHEYGILRTKLAHALRVTYDPEVAPVALDSVSTDLDSLAVYQDQAFRNRPELARLDSLLLGQSHRIAVRRSALLPQVYASAALHYGRPGVDAFRDRWMGYYTLGVQVRWRFWDWREDRRRISQARMDSAQVSLGWERAALDIRQTVAETYRRLETVRDQMAIQRRLVAQEQMRYQLTRAQFESGYATSLDLSDAEKALSEAELALQEYYVAWHVWDLQMRFMTGTIGHE